MLAFELLMRQVPTVTRPDPTEARPHATTIPANPTADMAERASSTRTPATIPDLGPAKPGESAGQTGPSPVSARPVHDQARQLVAERLAAAEPVTGAALARALGISDRYGQRLLADLRAEANDHPGARNGQPLDRDPATEPGHAAEEATD